MSIEDTRRLGIEFERRVQTMIPDTEFLDKLDTETIYSFLNQCQDKYVGEIYRNIDKILSGSYLSAHAESVLQGLMSETQIDAMPVEISISSTGRSVSYKLPNNFYMYLRSVSRVSKTFTFKEDINQGSYRIQSSIKILPNQLVSLPDMQKLIETPNDNLRILRSPIAALSNVDGNNVLTVIYDQYTVPEGIKITYYKRPARFSLITGKECELPLDAFEELVSGAVDLYVQYVAGAEARKRQLDEARRQAAKEQEANNARRGRNNE